MDGVGTTEENLKAAMAGENYEVVSMYPEFIADAEKEGDKKAGTSFKWAWEVEKGHEQLFKQALAQLGSAAWRAGNLGLPGVREYRYRQRTRKMPGLQYPRGAFRKDRLKNNKKLAGIARQFFYLRLDRRDGITYSYPIFPNTRS